MLLSGSRVAGAQPALCQEPDFGIQSAETNGADLRREKLLPCGSGSCRKEDCIRKFTRIHG